MSIATLGVASVSRRVWLSSSLLVGVPTLVCMQPWKLLVSGLSIPKDLMLARLVAVLAWFGRNGIAMLRLVVPVVVLIVVPLVSMTRLVSETPPLLSVEVPKLPRTFLSVVSIRVRIRGRPIV